MSDRWLNQSKIIQCERENKNQIALMVYNQEIEEIYTRLMQQIDAQKRVDKIKEILKKI